MSINSVQMIIGYYRVSTDDQETALQVNALEKAGCEKLYSDQGFSGRTFNRPALQGALKNLQEGDTLIVWKLDRLGRSIVDLMHLLNDLRTKDVAFVSLTEGIDTNTAGGRMFYGMLAVFAEYEADTIAERTRAGLAAAIKRGVKLGRPSALTIHQEELVRKMHQDGESMKELSRTFDVNYNVIRRVCGRKS